MNLTAYEAACEKSDISDRTVDFYVESMAEEVGEIISYVKRLHRGDYERLNDEMKKEIMGELGDLIWPIVRMSHAMGYTFEYVLLHNQSKVLKRLDQGTLMGRGSNREEKTN